MPGPKPGALPLGDTPSGNIMIIYKKYLSMIYVVNYFKSTPNGGNF